MAAVSHKKPTSAGVFHDSRDA